MKYLKNMKAEERKQEKKKTAVFHVMSDRAHFIKSSKSTQDRGEK